jgi:outer membrane receptor for ferric coprogen and ferric-rhodotorulic acid
MARSGVADAIRIALCGLTAPVLAVAQEQPTPAPAPSQAASLEETEEVIVQAKRYRPKDQTTATGLRLDLIDTPQSISVISEEMMDLAGVRSAYEAVDMVPGVHRQGTGFGSEFLIIRGQDAGDPRINGIDAYSASYLDAYATERLEIVRGPATVLYGVTASFGGEVNQVLKSPTREFAADIGFEAGDFDRQRFEADVGGAVPGTDGRLRLRAVGAYTDAGMYQDLVKPTNNIDKLALLAATYDFSDSTSLTAHIYRQERDLDAFDGCTLVEDENNVLSIPRAIPFDRFYCNDPRQSTALVDNDFAIASLSHVFGNEWRIEAKVAKSKTDRNLDYVYGFGPAGADIEGSLYLSEGEIYFLSYAELTEDESFTSNLSLGGEFELAGRTHEFLAALEYQSGDLQTTNYLSTSLGYLDLFEDGGKGILTDGSPIPPLPPPELAGVQDSDIEQMRGSVQLLFRPTDRLQVLAGALIQRTEQVDRNDLVDDDDTRAELTQTDSVGRLGLTYKLLEQGGERLSGANVYYSYSEGIEPNVGIFDKDGVALTDPQDMTSHEIGLKTEWLDGAIGSALAIYDAELTNVPSTTFGQIGESGTFSNVLDGKREYRGLELELVGEIVTGWNVAFGYAHTETKIFSPLIPQRLAIANVPEDQVSLFTSYEFTAGALDGLLLGVGIVHRMDAPLVDNANAIFEGEYDPNDQVLDTTTRVDFNASYSVGSGALAGLEIFAHVRNAFDEKEYFSLSGHPGFTNTLGAPRQFTFGLRHRFGR